MFLEDIFKLIESGSDPYGGLYIHLLQPQRKIIEPNKVIEAGKSVIKPGKFEGYLSQRMSSYFSSKYWKYEDTEEAAFKESCVKSYLILDASKLSAKHRWLIVGLEKKLGELVRKEFNILSKVGLGKSEYLEIEFTNIDAYSDKVCIISNEINNIVETFLKEEF